MNNQNIRIIFLKKSAKKIVKKKIHYLKKLINNIIN